MFKGTRVQRKPWKTGTRAHSSIIHENLKGDGVTFSDTAEGTHPAGRGVHETVHRGERDRTKTPHGNTGGSQRQIIGQKPQTKEHRPSM